MRPQAELIPRWMGYAIVVFLAATYAAGYAWSTSIPDTARDVYHAYQIRHGLAYPLEGPVLGIPHALHLGPVWFYLLALALWLSDTWLAMALWVGVLCSLKFPLALYCGRRWLGRDFGVLWAVALAIPGWQYFEELLFFNPNAIAMSLLLAFAACIRFADNPGSIARAFLLGLAVGFAIHIHPTTAPVALLGLAAVIVPRRLGLPWMRSLVALLAGMVLLALPYAWSQVAHGFPDWVGASRYVESRIGLANLLQLPNLGVALVYSGPEVIASYVLRWTPFAASVLAAGVALLHGPALMALLSKMPAQRRQAMTIAAAGLAMSLWIVLARPTTPFYFAYGLAPILAAWIALGLVAVSSVTAARPLVLAVVAGVMLLGTVTLRSLALQVRSGDGAVPAQVLDIKDRTLTSVSRDLWFPARDRKALGRLLCAQGKSALHGHLAYLEDRSVGLDAAFGCGSAASVGLMGTAPDAAHLTGMTRSFWSALGAAPRCWVGPLGIAQSTTALWPLQGKPIASGDKYFPRAVNVGAKEARTLEVILPPSSALLITNVLHGYEQLDVDSVRLDGREVAPAARNEFSWLYRSPNSASGPSTWTITVRSTDLGAVDVVSFSPGKSQARECFAGTRFMDRYL